jgi:hypothetical protein
LFNHLEECNKDANFPKSWHLFCFDVGVSEIRLMIQASAARKYRDYRAE